MFLHQKSKLSLWKRLQLRLQSMTDSEPEQAIKVRLPIAFAVALYFSLPWHEGEILHETFFSAASLTTLGYLLGAVMVVVAMIFQPTPSPVRRVSGSLLDLASLSILTFYAGEESVFMFVLYLWIILGNGFRYGNNYLYTSLFIGIIGFVIAITWGEYWQDPRHQAFSLSLLFLLLIIPLYSAFLINKLQGAIANAKEANEAKSRFLANMSHELRTPLNGVIGMADLMIETELNSQQYEFVNIMRNSANSLLGLIENVLDISKIEAGKITISLAPFDLHQLINSIIKIQSPMAAAKSIGMSCHFDAATPFSLQGDQQHLRQILVNLLANATKFTNEGEIKVFIFPVDNNSKRPVIRFEIQDTGIGLSESDMAIVFEDFAQVNSGSNYSIGGTGLGTTISKELVELMGGDIGVESIENTGSTFWFELPFTTVLDENELVLDKHILLLTTEKTADKMASSLASWQVTFDQVATSARAFSLLMQAVEQDNNYQIMLVEQSCIADIDPVQFAQMLKTEPELAGLSLVLVNGDEYHSYDSEIRQYYISSLSDLDDNRLLFNAIHVAQANTINDEKVVTLAEYFSKQKNAQPLNILIAEDNHVNRQVLEGILNHAGHSCSLAETGEQVLDLLADSWEKIDMLVLDMNMPDLDGIDVLKAMQYMEVNNPIPVIILTADATPEAKTKCLSAGANAFLTKPINSRALLKKIAQLSADSKKDITVIDTDNNELSSWIDATVIRDLIELGGGKAFIHQLLDGFKQDGDKHLTTLNKAAADDYFNCRASLHALKGSATELGAFKLADLCLQCEAIKSYEIDSPQLYKLIKLIEDGFTNTIKAIENSLETAEIDIRPHRPN